MESSEEIARGFASLEFKSRLDLWRTAHPRATLREIEAAIDEELARVRAEMVGRLASRSPLQDIAALPLEERPRCERCHVPLLASGKRRRKLKGPGGEEASLDRSYAVCPRCDLGLFPPR